MVAIVNNSVFYTRKWSNCYFWPPTSVLRWTLWIIVWFIDPLWVLTGPSPPCSQCYSKTAPSLRSKLTSPQRESGKKTVTTVEFVFFFLPWRLYLKQSLPGRQTGCSRQDDSNLNHRLRITSCTIQCHLYFWKAWMMILFFRRGTDHCGNKVFTRMLSFQPENTQTTPKNPLSRPLPHPWRIPRGLNISLYCSCWPSSRD